MQDNLKKEVRKMANNLKKEVRKMEDNNIKKAIEVSYKDLAKGEYSYLGIAIPIKALIEKVKKWNYKEDDIIKIIKSMYYNDEVEFFYGNENTLIINHKGYYYMAIKYLEEEVI